jgi:hypothetical protein
MNWKLYGAARGLIEVISWHSSEGTEKKHERPARIAREARTYNVTATPTCSLRIRRFIPPHLHASSWDGVTEHRGIYAFIHARYMLRPSQPPLNHSNDVRRYYESLQCRGSQAHTYATSDVSTEWPGKAAGWFLGQIPQGLQAYDRTLPRLGHELFLSNPLQFIIHPTTDATQSADSVTQYDAPPLLNVHSEVPNKRV